MLRDSFLLVSTLLVTVVAASLRSGGEGDGGQQAVAVAVAVAVAGEEQNKKDRGQTSQALGLMAAGNICPFSQAPTAAAVFNPPTDD